MIQRTGTVRAVTNRDFNDVKLWSFQMEGSDRYFRTGKNEPSFQEGDTITFEEKNGIVITDSIAIGGEPTETVETTMTEVVKQTDQPSVVGKRIQYQAARADACNIIVAALAADHLPHSANTAKGKRLDLLLGYVDEVTKTLIAQESAYEAE